MKNLVIAVVLIAGALMCASCSRLVHWAQQTVPQVEKITLDISPACAYVRTLQLYNQFTTVALFDVLRLSDTVRTVYAELYSLEHCKSEELATLFLRRQLQENAYFISFYVLMPQTKENSISFGDQPGMWSLCLWVDGLAYTPQEVKTVELAPEYRRIFGNRYNRFKVPYLVRFDANDIQGRPIVRPTTSKIKLCFTSAHYSISTCWPLTPVSEDKSTAQLCHTRSTF